MKLLRLILLILFSMIILTGCMSKSPSFVDLGNGVIEVNSSPLMWQQRRSPNFTDWESAKEYVDNLDLGGYSDWRLPTKKEFLGLYFAFDSGNAKAGKDTLLLEGNYWSTENDGIGFAGIWKDGESCEISRAYKVSMEGYVRAVRMP